MKTVKNSSEIKRVSNETAEQLVDSGKWSFTSKKEWKELVRDANKKKAE